MKKNPLNLLVISMFLPFCIPTLVQAHPPVSKKNYITCQFNGKGKPILIQKICNPRYHKLAADNHHFLLDNITKESFHFSKILEKLKHQKDSVVIGTFHHDLENHFYNHLDLLENVSLFIYENCCPYFTDYTQQNLFHSLERELIIPKKPGEKISKTILFIAQTPETGDFMSNIPVNVTIQSQNDSHGTKYLAKVQFINYVTLLN